LRRGDMVDMIWTAPQTFPIWRVSLGQCHIMLHGNRVPKTGGFAPLLDFCFNWQNWNYWRYSSNVSSFV